MAALGLGLYAYVWVLVPIVIYLTSYKFAIQELLYFPIHGDMSTMWLTEPSAMSSICVAKGGTKAQLDQMSARLTKGRTISSELGPLALLWCQGSLP